MCSARFFVPSAMICLLGVLVPAAPSFSYPDLTFEFPITDSPTSHGYMNAVSPYDYYQYDFNPDSTVPDFVVVETLVDEATNPYLLFEEFDGADPANPNLVAYSNVDSSPVTIADNVGILSSTFIPLDQLNDSYTSPATSLDGKMFVSTSVGNGTLTVTESVTGGVGPVAPEPASVALVLSAGVILLHRRRTRH